MAVEAPAKPPADKCGTCGSYNGYVRVNGEFVCRKCGRVTKP